MNAISVLAIAIAIARTEVMASATAIRAVEPDPVSTVCKNVLDVFSAAAAVVDNVAILTAIAIAITTAVAIAMAMSVAVAVAICAVVVDSAIAATADFFVVIVESAFVGVDVARNDCRERCVNGIAMVLMRAVSVVVDWRFATRMLLSSPILALPMRTLLLPLISLSLVMIALRNVPAIGFFFVLSLTNCVAFLFPQAAIERALFIDTHSPSESEFA